MTSTVPPVPPTLQPMKSSLMTSSFVTSMPKGASSWCDNGPNPLKLHHQMALYRRGETDLAALLEKSVRIMSGPGRSMCYDVWYHQDIVPQLQVGPMCGLVALSIATQIDVLTLLAEAKGMKLTSFGEMFSAQWMCHLINQSQSLNKFRATVTNTRDHLTWGKLTEYFKRKCFILVAYDLGGDMKIGFRKGHKAHWVLLVGFMLTKDYAEVTSSGNADWFAGENLKFSSNGPEKMEMECAEGAKFVLGFHGKSRRMCIYNLEELVESNQQLLEPGNFVDESFVVPSEGLESHLSGKIVVLEQHK